MIIKRNYKGSDNLSTGKICAFYITKYGGGFWRKDYNLIRKRQATRLKQKKEEKEILDKRLERAFHISWRTQENC